jgi:hypothetical protein
VDTIRHPRELPSTDDDPPPLTDGGRVPVPGASPPTGVGPSGPRTSTAPVDRTAPPVVNPPLVALGLTVLFLLVLLVAVLLGPDGDRAGADEPPERVPAPVVDPGDPRPTGR